MNNPPDFILQFRRRDYPFQIACVQPPPPLRKKIGEGVSVGKAEGGDCTQASLRRIIRFQSSSSVKTANNNTPVSSVFNDSEGLYGATVSRCLVRRHHYFARLMRFGSPGLSEFATEMP